MSGRVVDGRWAALAGRLHGAAVGAVLEVPVVLLGTASTGRSHSNGCAARRERRGLGDVSADLLHTGRLPDEAA